MWRRKGFLAVVLSVTLGSSCIARAGCDIIAIGAGGQHALAVHGPEGSVWAWGRNNSGALGDGTFTDRLVPTLALHLRDVVSVAGGSGHCLAIKSDGSLWSWGGNGDGQLGDGTHPDRPEAGQVWLTGVVKVAAGSVHSMALLDDGYVWAWGQNIYGQVGDGTFTSRDAPWRVPLPGPAISIAAGSTHSVALLADGSVWTWGGNYSSQLGIGTTCAPSPCGSSAPVQVLGPGGVGFLSGVVAIEANGSTHTLAARQDGTMWAWGYNGHGELGDGTATESATPVQVANLAPFTSFTLGSNHSMALLTDQTIVGWGGNWVGQLGKGDNADSWTPVPALNLTGVTAIADCSIHSHALLGDGSVWSWGGNAWGELGDGTSTDSNLPVQTALDGRPPDQGNVLLAVRVNQDVSLTWTGAGAAKWQIYRDADRTTLGVSPNGAPASTESFLDAGPVPSPSFYQVKGLSLCSATPGP